MKLLVTGAFNCTPEQLDTLRDKGYDVTFMQNESDKLPCPYSEVEGVICNGLFLHHPIEKFIGLRFVQLTSVGFDRMPMDYAKEHGIDVYNARGVYSVPMAEFALCGVLQLYKQSKFFMQNQEKRCWEKHRGLLELFGKNVCIVGCGSVGNECAKRFAAFGCKVSGVDLFPREDKLYTEMVGLDGLDVSLKSADVVVLTLPLTEITRGMLNAERLERMKENSVLVNIARGTIVDEQALCNALQGKLLGAVLDVFESEPLAKNSSLWDMENVLITPHNSFVGEKNGERLWEIVLNNMENYYMIHSKLPF